MTVGTCSAYRLEFAEPTYSIPFSPITGEEMTAPPVYCVEIREPVLLTAYTFPSDDPIKSDSSQPKAGDDWRLPIALNVQVMAPEGVEKA